MQYMLLIYGDPSTPPRSDEEHEALFQDFAAWSKELRARDVVVAGNPLAPTSSATTVRIRNGKSAITDGPFAEALEILDGLAHSELRQYHMFHLARADMLKRLGRIDEAICAYNSALDLTQNIAERRHLHALIASSSARNGATESIGSDSVRNDAVRRESGRSR